MDQLVHQIAADFINGNITQVKNSFRDLTSMNAAYLGISVYQALAATCNDDAVRFAKVISEWADVS